MYQNLGFWSEFNLYLVQYYLTKMTTEGGLWVRGVLRRHCSWGGGGPHILTGMCEYGVLKQLQPVVVEIVDRLCNRGFLLVSI